MEISLSDDIARLGIGRRPEVESTSNELGQEDFLTLMIAQFRNQDPFEPLDNGAFLGQLAQFGTVEGIERLNSGFSQLSSALGTDQALQAANLVGRTVIAASDRGYLPSEGNLSGAVELSSSAQNVQVDITDASGQLIRRIDLGQQAAGRVEFQWDGVTNDQELASEGIYSISARVFRGTNVEGIETLIKADIASVNLGRFGEPMILNMAGGEGLTMSQVRSIL